MEALIPTVNRLQDVFSTIGFAEHSVDLPQIVVVGSQSSGKSSVLESIVGRDFLPRGSGIVTRVPLVIQLNHIQARGKGRGQDEWAVFLHMPDKKFYDFDQVREEVNRQTDKLAGEKKNIVDKPISLRVYSPNVLNLTLVDLPGITKIPIADQPGDIEEQIRALTLRYISKPNSIILAVSPANADIANSDSIKIAREVDPGGRRTIGVCTKLDLMDKGTDATDVLTGRVIPLKLGMIGVVNRSQHDINTKKSMASARQDESDFFAERYQALKHRCGAQFLAATLNKLLMLHIRDSLPELKTRIKKLQDETDEQLADLGEPLVQERDKSGQLLQILSNFATTFKDTIDGRSTVATSSTELIGGAMICHIFHNTFAHSLSSIGPLDGLTLQDIQRTIRNTTGTRPSLFIPEASFELLVKKQIRRLLEPGLRCVELVFQELERLVHSCVSQELSRFRGLRDQVLEVSTRMLKDRLPDTNAMVENLIAIEASYINTNHPQFEGGSGAMSKMLSRLSEGMAQQGAGSAPPPAASTGAATSGYPSRAGVGDGAPGAMDGSGAMFAPTPNPPRRPYARDRAGVTDVEFVNADAARSNLLDTGQYTPQRQDSSPANRNSWTNFLSFTRPAPERAPPPPGTPMILSTPTTGDFFQPPGAACHADEELVNLSSKERMEVELVQSLIDSYFSIVRDKIADSIPKTIMHFLVNHVQEKMQTTLLQQLWVGQDYLDDLLLEDSQVAEQRERTTEMLAALRKALEIINEVSML
eukprot:m.24002 g.24002  ORF g.24002 m.24002 type:complete len:759 (+) comp11124_c0_seq1:289-2565(+)